MKFSTTLLNTYRMFRDHEFISLERMEADIRGEREPPNADMLRGTALGTVLAEPNRCAVEGEDLYACTDETGGAWTFDACEIDCARSRMDVGLFEVPAWLEIDGHTISCRADGISGTRVVEVKCPKTPVLDPQRYMDSFQWRVYLLAFEAQICEYHLISLREVEKGSPVLGICDHHIFKMHRYQGLEDDVKELVRDLAGFVRARGLESYR